jgi:hypothetical protein
MKNLVIYSTFMVLIFSVLSCKTKESVLDEMLSLDNTSVLYEGSFVSANNYTTMGTAVVVVENGKRKLIFKDFQTTPGPDLKVYLSTATSPTDFIDLGELKASTGTFSYDLDTNIDFGKQNHVLVWCKRFSRLFGSTSLTKK